MSLSKLSTEIDEIIIQYLPQHARHSLTLTSKSYHKVANPYLYRNIRVRESDALSVARFLLSLLGRTELQQYIQSFDLISASKRRALDAPHLGDDDPNIEARRKTIENINQDLFSKSLHIWKAIERFAYHLGGLTFARNWYFRVLEATKSIDGTIGLILCLATNLESLQLMDLGDGITEAVCRAQWQECITWASSAVWPLRKLKSLVIALELGAAIPVLTPVETLKASGRGWLHSFEYPCEGSDKMRTLRSLELRDIAMRADHLDCMISLPELGGVHHLRMGNVRIEERAGYDYERLSDLLQLFLPSLRTFEWTGEIKRRRYQTYIPFGSFTGFKQLEELVLGFEYIRPNDDNINDPPAHLLDPPYYFPISLATLKITEVPQGLLHNLQETCEESPLDNFILKTAVSRELSNFDLFVTSTGDVASEYAELSNTFLPKLIASLDNVGTSLRFHRQRQGRDSELLYHPDHAAV
ncbi:hypothetical protein J4E93_010692 [Alternaria ventricosa]|uniref:uncharacterized protein n=1 Tax=Alternaria ventricosa TaxID=1187951 RepID=UPI0020C30EAB|nr:uncharacterized protein J4E93_010692 [Alternaria ventricosa]KAI4637026.1 hypothetical protein J4E93_010692 [Alternaria ventricosa]